MVQLTRKQRRTAERKARIEALRERRRLGNSDNYRFDIFNAIKDAGIWLMFQPLKNLYGFYQRTEDASGIVIHQGHPMTLQRYTAAHEYGHHVLGHIHSLDSRTEIEGGLTNGENRLQEIAAQAFAGALLMPLTLIQRACNELSIDITKPSQINVYDLSLRFGVSYQAMRIQLRAYDLISYDIFNELDCSPLDIKKQLGDGEPPVDHRAELWIIDEDSDLLDDLYIQIADEVVIRIKEIRSSGYRWRLNSYQDSSLELVDNRLNKDSQDNCLGGSSTRRFRFRALRGGHTQLHFVLNRTFEPDNEIQALDLNISVAAPITSNGSKGLMADQHSQLAARQT